MRQTHHYLAPSTLRRDTSLPPRLPQEPDSALSQSPVGSQDVSDRQAVIAVMVGGGLACEDVALVLSLPLRVVQEDLQRAMETLGLTDPHDLLYAIVAARYHRPPASPAETECRAKNTPHQEDDGPGGGVFGPVRFARSLRTVDPHASVNASTGVAPVDPVNSLVLLDASEGAQGHTYPRFETVCFLRPSNASYLEATEMLRSARREIEQEHLHANEYVLAVEVWGDETHGVHDYRGQRVDLTGGPNTIYWYRATITQHQRPTDRRPQKQDKQPSTASSVNSLMIPNASKAAAAAAQEHSRRPAPEATQTLRRSEKGPQE
jgi:hypothetical protein